MRKKYRFGDTFNDTPLSKFEGYTSFMLSSSDFQREKKKRKKVLNFSTNNDKQFFSSFFILFFCVTVIQHDSLSVGYYIFFFHFISLREKKRIIKINFFVFV